MGLNCKPGDLAVHIGRSGDETCQKNQGRLFEVLYRANDVNGEVSWVVRAVGSAYARNWGLVHGATGECVDRLLRPVRDPGDDAVDETLINNPVRHEVTA